MNPIDVLKYGHLTVSKGIDGLADEHWLTDGVCGVWSVKDIIAHLASYEHVLIEVLSTFLDDGAGTETPYMTEMGTIGPQAFNDLEVEKRQNSPKDAILDEYNTTHAQAMVLAAQVSPQTWTQVGTLPWYGAEYALDDLIVYSSYGHKREHTAQIAVFRDTLISSRPLSTNV